MIIFKKSQHLLFFFVIGLLAASSFFVISCKDEQKDFTSDIVFPDSLISFIYHVEPLFRETCVDPRCHGGSQPAADLNLESNTWTALMDHNLIVVKNGNASRLVQYLDGRLQPQMPLGHPLTQNQINGVKKWIDEGAKNL